MQGGFISTKETSAEAIKETLRIYLRIIVKGWKLTLPIVLAVVAGTLLIFYVPPLIIASLINQTTTLTLANAWPMALLFGAAWLGGEMLWRLAMHLMLKYQLQTIATLYSDAVTTLVKKELTFYSNRFTGTITKNLLAYGHRFLAFFDTLVFEVASNLFPALFAAIILAFISPWLSIALIVMLAIGGFITVPLIRRRLVLVRDREEAYSKMAGHTSDVITNMAAIKSFGAEDAESKTNTKYLDDYITKAKRSWHYQNSRVDMAISPIYVATNMIGLAIVLSLGVEPETKAALFIAFSYYSTVTRFLWSFNGVYRRLEESITDASQFVNYTLDAPKVLDIEGAKRLHLKDGAISFHDVGFTHDGTLGVLFRDFNVDIQPGQKVGLVGHSGAGKSTIVNLLLRFMNIDEGTILIDSQDISKVTQKSLHESIAFVPQEPLLFHRSLRENIAYGKPNATDDEIRTAAKKAHALEFIETLPQGFDTLVGERGVKLSGGQRQRIAIARAILKDAPILVLDEATSALDSESEKLIQASLGALMKDRTSIVIAHRLSTIAKLDRIIVLENGSVIEDGSHAELLKQNKTYAKLWNHQSGGFIEE